MRSLGSRCRDCDEVCEINGSKVVKRGKASEGEVLRTCRVAAEDFCLCLCVCVVVSFSVSLHAHSYCLIVEFLAMFSPEFWLEILNPTSWNINFKTSLCNLRKRMVVKSILNCFMHSSGRFL